MMKEIKENEVIVFGDIRITAQNDGVHKFLKMQTDKSTVIIKPSAGNLVIVSSSI